MRLGDIVTLTQGPKAGLPHVVVHEAVRGQWSEIERRYLYRIQLCYCGSERWYVPVWHDAATVSTEIPDSDRLKRARFLLSEVTADPDGWKRLTVGRDGQCRQVVVGHISQDEPR